MNDFETFFKENSIPIFRYFYYKGVKQITSEDLTSEAFLRLFQKFEKTYNKQILWGIAKNIYKEYIRKIVKENEVGDFDEELFVSVEEYYDEKFEEKIDSMKIQVREMIKELSPNVQKVIYLRYIEGLPVEEIAEKENMPVTTVKKYQQRGIKYLQEIQNKRVLSMVRA